MEIILLAALGAFLGVKAYHQPKETKEFIDGVYELLKILLIVALFIIFVIFIVYLISETY